MVNVVENSRGRYRFFQTHHYCGGVHVASGSQVGIPSLDDDRTRTERSLRLRRHHQSVAAEAAARDRAGTNPHNMADGWVWAAIVFCWWVADGFNLHSIK